MIFFRKSTEQISCSLNTKYRRIIYVYYIKTVVKVRGIRIPIFKTIYTSYAILITCAP